jgi:hypothetical protein
MVFWNEIKRCRRKRGMKISAKGEGAEWKKLFILQRPNELNYASPWLIMGQIQKLLDTFHPNKKGQFRQKTISRYCPFDVA